MYLAAREVGVKLPGGEWWEVFDVEREELGFLVVGMGSLEGWVGGLKEEEGAGEGEGKGKGKGGIMVTVEEVEVELGRLEVEERGGSEVRGWPLG